MGYYLLIALIVIIGQINAKEFKGNKFLACFTIFLMIILSLAVILMMPLRIDMIRYLKIFEINSVLTWPEALAYVRWEPGFVTFQWILSKISISNNFFIITSLVTMWALLITSLKKIFPLNQLQMILFGYISFFYIYNFFSNILRQGFAIFLVLFVLVFLINKSYKKATFFLIMSMSFHVSASIGLLLILVRKFNITLKFLLVLFGLSCLLMITGINQTLMGGIANFIGGRLGETVGTYTTDTVISLYGSINRIDFLLFTLFWVIWGLWFKRKFNDEDGVYEWVLKSYLTFSIIYILFGFIGFSDRIAVFAWSLIPILIFYPYIQMKSYQQMKFLILCVTISIFIFLFFGTYKLYLPLNFFY